MPTSCQAETYRRTSCCEPIVTNRSTGFLTDDQRRRTTSQLDETRSDLSALTVSRPDPHYGETIVAFVVLAEGATQQKPEVVTAIRTACQTSLAKFKNPRVIEVVAELPKIGNNKIHRPALRDLAKQLEPVATH